MRKDITGQKFSRLSVLGFGGIDKSNHSMWICKCECGNEITTSLSNLISGHTTSCGCVFRENAAKRLRTHGLSNDRLYFAWCNMKNRCANPRTDSYEFYGQRGISVCKEWADSFDSFKEWAMSNGYDDKKTIDRVDVNGNYEPSNCRWVGLVEQANNKSNNVRLEYNGKCMTIAEWSRELGIDHRVIRQRLRRGWSVERTLTTQNGDDKWHKLKTSTN